MKIKILGSSSKGNCYFLSSDGGEILILEAGVDIKTIKKELGGNLDKVVGCLVTHEHQDHAKSIEKLLDTSIDVYASSGTLEGIKHHRVNCIKSLEKFNVGKFKVLPFDVEHDAREPLGFYINHPESGNILFATDTCFIPYNFKDINHCIIECNYSNDLLDRMDQEFLKKRIRASHFGLEDVLNFISTNETRLIKNIMLIHLSDGNSDENKFKNIVRDISKTPVVIADKGVELNLDLTEF